MDTRCCERVLDNKSVRSHLSSPELPHVKDWILKQTMPSCPCCRIEGESDAQTGEFLLEEWKSRLMTHPNGSRSFFSHVTGRQERVSVRGLSCCKSCKTLWARDFSAALNIGYIFVFAMMMNANQRPRYLCSW